LPGANRSDEGAVATKTSAHSPISWLGFLHFGLVIRAQAIYATGGAL
jgi:hypothetical protein